jgi:hypothetical protein
MVVNNHIYFTSCARVYVAVVLAGIGVRISACSVRPVGCAVQKYCKIHDTHIVRRVGNYKAPTQ